MARKGAIVDSTQEFEKALRDSGKAHYVLRLYIAGNSHRSNEAILNIREICETHLKGRYRLEVVDVYQQPTLAKGEQIIAAPTLIKRLPLPLRRIIGDMSEIEKVLLGLDLRPVAMPPAAKPAAKSPRTPKKTTRRSRTSRDGG